MGLFVANYVCSLRVRNFCVCNGFYDVCLGTAKHAKIVKLRVNLGEIACSRFHALRWLIKTSNVVGSGYVSKLGVLGSVFGTFCEIWKFWCLGLVWMRKKNYAKYHLLFELFSNISLSLTWGMLWTKNTPAVICCGHAWGCAGFISAPFANLKSGFSGAKVHFLILISGGNWVLGA